MTGIRPEVREYIDKVHAIAEALGGAAAIKAVESGSIQPPNHRSTDHSGDEDYFYSLAPDGSVIKKKLFSK